jgi:hypothetical protein
VSDDANIYDVGDAPTLEGDFAINGVPFDPASVVCRIRKPGASSSFTVATTHPGVGRFAATVVVDKAGDWYYRFEGSGGLEAAGERRFHVRPSNVLP